MRTDNPLVDKSYAFALRVVKLYRYLSEEKKEFVISKQILRSGTSIGANVEEALAGISMRDFIAKMSIASKESRETRYWIKLIESIKLLDYDYQSIKKEIDEIICLLTAIVKTSQSKLNKK